MNQAYLKTRLRYRTETGLFYWIKASRNRGQLLNRRAGSNDGKGYIRIGIDGTKYFARRLAYLYVYGFIRPIMDHKNRRRDDNRITNLRPCAHSQNCQNIKQTTNGSGLPRGVAHQSNRYQAQITFKGVCHYLGLFDTPEAASVVYQQKRTEFFGDFS